MHVPPRNAAQWEHARRQRVPGSAHKTQALATARSLSLGGPDRSGLGPKPGVVPFAASLSKPTEFPQRVLECRPLARQPQTDFSTRSELWPTTMPAGVISADFGSQSVWLTRFCRLK